MLTKAVLNRAREDGVRLAACLSGLVAVVSAWRGIEAIALASVLLLVGCVVLSAVIDRRRARRLARLADDGGHGGLDGSIDTLEERLMALTCGAGDHPLELPQLLSRVAADGVGRLAVVHFADVDRTGLFDPEFSERLCDVLFARLSRMIGPSHDLARLERARFALWFGGSAADAAEAEMEALSYALGAAVEEEGASIVPIVHTALLRFPEDAGTPSALLARAMSEIAFHHARGAQAQVVAELPTRERFLMEQDLRHAIDRREFSMHYQPLVDATSGELCGAEALIRWRHREHGMISPGDFVPMAETIGLAEPLGLWALNVACRDAARWHRPGPPLRVAVNVSARQLDRADLRQLVERTLSRHSLPPERLEIELTESVAASDPRQGAALIDALRGLGVRVAIDDFGTGYSSLAALRQLSFDKIKIDRSFVTEVEARRDSQAICQSIIALGRGLGIAVLAEGVERFEEYAWLRRHGCTLFQGYYFARPMPAADFAAFAARPTPFAGLVATDPRSAQARLEERLTR